MVNLSLSGTEIPVYLLDGTRFVLRVVPTTTVGGVLISLREKLGMVHDSHYGLFEAGEDGEFRILDDRLYLSRVMAKWDSLVGAHALYYRRSVYFPDSEASVEELKSAETGHGAHRLAFVDAMFHFEHGHYRFDWKHVVAMAALLLQAKRGPYYTGVDTPGSLANLSVTLCPPYATTDRCHEHPLVNHQPGLLPSADALHSSALGKAVYEELQRMDTAMPVLAAEEAFLGLSRENPCYGFDVFVGQRAWGMHEEGGVLVRDKGEGEEEGGGHGEQHSEHAPGEEVLEDVMLCVGHMGLTIVSQENPLEAQLVVEFSDLVSWACDDKLFVFTVVDDAHHHHHHQNHGGGAAKDASLLAGGVDEHAGEHGSPIYIITPAADAVQASLERYLAVRLKHLETPPGEPLPVPPRTMRGAGPIPVITQVFVAPPPEWVKPAGGGHGGDGSSSSSSSSSTSHLDALRDLPTGWVSATDGEGDIFYYHTLTKTTTWQHPGRPTGPLPEGWCEVADPLDAKRYFFHPAKRVVTWERPGGEDSSSSSGGSSSGSSGGRGGGGAIGRYAASSATAAGVVAAAGAPLTDLPFGWAVAYDSTPEGNGRPYYFSKNGKTQWVKPTTPVF